MSISVYGLGEGLVSGLLDADNYQFNRELDKIEKALTDKKEALIQDESGGLKKVTVDPSKIKSASLTDAEVKKIADITMDLEDKLGKPQDCEWGFEGDKLYFLQTRPITTLPNKLFYEKSVNYSAPNLWDNSNIIESYSGITSPLTFSFAKAYQDVYLLFAEVMSSSSN